jgi:hypothetical protein
MYGKSTIVTFSTPAFEEKNLKTALNQLFLTFSSRLIKQLRFL